MAKRDPGKPRTGKEALTPQKLLKLGKLFLRGMTVRELATVFNCSATTIQHHVDSLRIEWKESQKGLLEQELAKVQELERVAWECFEESKSERRVTIKRERGMSAADMDPKTTKGKKNHLVQKGAPLEVVEKAITKITRTGSPAYLQIVQWCLEYRAKVMGFFRDQGSQDMDEDAPSLVFIELESREDLEQFQTMARFQKQIGNQN